jgi:dihydroorotate dehydrogenase
MEPSTKVLADFYRLTEGKIPLIGVGGIASGKDAYEKILNGASLVQLYSALVYHGLELVTEIKEDLARRLRKDGFASVADAVGAAFPEISGRKAPVDEARAAKAAVTAKAETAPATKKPAAKATAKKPATKKPAAKSKTAPKGSSATD